MLTVIRDSGDLGLGAGAPVADRNAPMPREQANFGKERIAMVEKKADTAGAGDRNAAHVDDKAVPVCSDVADLAEWRHKAKGRKGARALRPEWRERARLFSRREKEAMLFGLLLSEAIPDEQLDAMLEAVVSR